MSDYITRRLLNVLLGNSAPSQVIYPVENYAAGAGALVLGATMTVAAGAWPAYVDIVAAAAITQDFWVTQLFIDTVTLACTIDLQIYNATTVKTIWEQKFVCTAVSSNLTPTTFPWPIYCAPSSQIRGRIGGTAGKTCNVSLMTAIGL